MEDDEYLHRRDAEGAEFPQKELTDRIIGAAMEVHGILGPGLLESVYHKALQHELSLRRIEFQSHVALPVVYKSVALDAPLWLDLLVGTRVIIEVKSVDSIHEIHRAQLLTYLRLTGLQVGLIVNFNVQSLKQGLKRVVNSAVHSASSATLR